MLFRMTLILLKLNKTALKRMAAEWHKIVRHPAHWYLLKEIGGKQDEAGQKNILQNDPHQIDIHQNDIRKNDIHQNDILMNDIHQNDIHQNGIHQNDIHQNDIHQNDIHQNDIHSNDNQQNDTLPFVTQQNNISLEQFQQCLLKLMVPIVAVKAPLCTACYSR